MLTLPMFAWSTPRVEGTPPPARMWHTAASVGMRSTGAFRMLIYGGTSATGTALKDCHLLTPLLPPVAPVDPNAEAKGAKGGKKDDKKGKGGKGAPEPEAEPEIAPPEFRWTALPASPPPAAASAPSAAAQSAGAPSAAPSASMPSVRPATAGGFRSESESAASAPAFRPESAPLMPRVGPASGLSGMARKPSPERAAGALAVSTPECAIHIYASGGGADRDGAPLELLHAFEPQELLSEEELAALAGPPPPSLEFRGLGVSGLSAATMAAALTSECSVLVRRTDTSDVLGRAALLPFAQPGGRDAKLICALAAFAIPSDASGYPGESCLTLEVLIGGEPFASAPLAPLLQARREGSVQHVGLQRASTSTSTAGAAAGAGDAHHGAISFDFVRLGPPSAGDLAPPPPPPPPSASSARAALDATRPGAGATVDEYVGPFLHGLPHGHGVCTYASGARYEGQWKAGQRHGTGELRDE